MDCNAYLSLAELIAIVAHIYAQIIEVFLACLSKFYLSSTCMFHTDDAICLQISLHLCDNVSLAADIRYLGSQQRPVTLFAVGSI